MSSNTNPRPNPEYQGPGHYWIPSFSWRDAQKGVGYDIRLEEMGWRCYCRFCRNPWACKHVERLVDYLFEQEIISVLPEQKPLSPAKQYMAAGGSLSDLFDYASFAAPPTHTPTRRSKVAARR